MCFFRWFYCLLIYFSDPEKCCCGQPLTDFVGLPCGHVVCDRCWREAVDRNRTCPSCKHTIGADWRRDSRCEESPLHEAFSLYGSRCNRFIWAVLSDLVFNDVRSRGGGPWTDASQHLLDYAVASSRRALPRFGPGARQQDKVEFCGAGLLDCGTTFRSFCSLLDQVERKEASGAGLAALCGCDPAPHSVRRLFLHWCLVLRTQGERVHILTPFWTLLVQPATMALCYLPAMPQDESSEIKKATDGTRPGFYFALSNNCAGGATSLRQLTAASAAILRILQELALLAAVDPSSACAEGSLKRTTLHQLLELDLGALSDATGLNKDDCVTALHLVVLRGACLENEGDESPDLSCRAGRDAYEGRLVSRWLGTFLETLHEDIDEANQLCTKNKNSRERNLGRKTPSLTVDH